jgi:hypothetical protein
MGADEEGTLAQFKTHRRELVDPKISDYGGRIVKTTGDGLLVEFASVVDAIRCAVDVQKGMAERNALVPQTKRIEFRIGIHQGDIISDAGDTFGDAVNIAARLEALSIPGGICVSSRAQEDALGKLDVAFEDMGAQQLKNISKAVRAYRIGLAGVSAQFARQPLALPDKPSIAVLPIVAPVGRHGVEELMSPDCIDHRGLLADEQMAGAVENQAALLLGGFGWDKPHVGPGDCLANGLCISRIILLALDVGLHIGRWDQPHGVTQCLELARPVVRRPAGFDTDQTWRKLVEERQDVAALQLAANNHLAASVNAVNLEN